MTVSANPRARQPQQRGIRRKAEIIDVALRLFGERGYRATSLAEISKEVGISQAGLLHHFGTKEDLLLAVLRERDRDTDVRFGLVRGTEGIEALEALKSVVRYNESVRGLVQLFALLSAESIPSDQPGHDYFATRYRILRRRLMQQLQMAQDHGEIRNDRELAMVTPLLLAVIDGLQLQWLMDESEVDMSRSFALFLDAIEAWLLDGPRNAAPAPDAEESPPVPVPLPG